MRNLLIIGSGGHGKVVADAAMACRKYDRIGFLDDRYKEIARVMNLQVLGPVLSAEKYIAEFNEAIIAVGDNRLRIQWLEFFQRIGFRIPVLIHPAAYVGMDVIIGEGTVLFANSVVNPGAVIGKGVIVNTAATVDHDARIADGVHLSPGVHLAGAVSVGSYSWIGTGAAVIPRVQIGLDVTVGAGTVVIRDISDGVTVVGNPGRIVRKERVQYD